MRFSPDDRVGNYRIERVLGSTVTGVLYEATHAVLPRRAVLKVTATPAAAKQLLREACILEALGHPGAPQVYESGLLPDKRPWIAVEAIEGVIVQGPLTPYETATLIRDIAAVLEHAHRRGVYHRGLRPDRVVVTPGRRFPICIPDWSEARAHDAEYSIPHLPAPGARQHLAPELVRGDTVDDRVDVYALGVIAYLALTGHHPDESRTPVEKLCPDAPTELCAMIEQMLANDRFDRPASAEVRADLDFLATVMTQESTPTPVEDIVLIDTDGVPEELPRIRKPRWTPTFTMAVPADPAELIAEVTSKRS